MSCRKLLRVIGVFVLLFGYPISPSVAARSLTITSPTTLLFGDQDMIVTASTSGFVDGETIYIKGAFFQSGTTNSYFGFTKFGDGWVKNSASNASQRSVKIGEWDGTLFVKSDFSDSGYKGEGDYSLKVRYYYGSFTGDWSTNALTVAINEPDPTATLTPSPSLTPTLTIAPTSQPTGTPIVSATRVPTLMPTVVIRPTNPGVSDILGAQQVASQDADIPGLPGSDVVKIGTPSGNTARPVVFSLLFIGTGTGLLAVALALQKTDLWKTHIDQQRHQK